VLISLISHNLYCINCDKHWWLKLANFLPQTARYWCRFTGL